MPKAKKKNSNKYDSELSMEGSFGDVTKASVTPGNAEPKKEKENASKGK